MSALINSLYSIHVFKATQDLTDQDIKRVGVILRQLKSKYKYVNYFYITSTESHINKFTAAYNFDDDKFFISRSCKTVPRHIHVVIQGSTSRYNNKKSGRPFAIEVAEAIKLSLNNCSAKLDSHGSDIRAKEYIRSCIRQKEKIVINGHMDFRLIAL